ncbi:E3 SUMO-protein ligase ZBED1-like [Planococcus citri]|uniref:E3 SUMO-protein ligase ZBED1-like n=1 Tax=Planococcus citri TaxID=170843 RepID=UPI0031F8162E
MPRKNLSKIHDFYEYIDGKSICQVTDIAGNVCEVAVKGRHAGNLEKHVFRNHESVWNDYYHNYKLPMLAKEEASYSTPPPKRAKIAPEYVKVTDKALDNSNFTYRNVEKACITMATVDGRPLSFVEDIGFRMILDPLLGIMNNTDRKNYINFSMNKNKLQKLIKEEAENLKYAINKKIASRLICLKIDCASIFNKHFLSLNVFFKEPDGFCLHTLPLVEVPDISNSDVIKMTILESLSLYGILPAQIYALVVDSTVNIVSPDDISKDESLEELLFDEYRKPADESEAGDANECKTESDPNASTNSANDSEFDTFVIEVDYESESITTVNEPAAQSQSQSNNVQDKSEEFINKVVECWADEDISCVVCPAHLFELVIKEALKRSNMISLPKKVREILKKYRTPEFLRTLYVHSKRTILLDHPDKWISTYDMFQRLLELKPFLKKMSQSKDLFISANQWKQIDDYITSYAPVRAAAHKLLTENVSLSEFFKIWTTCLLKTKKIGTPLADVVIQVMQQHQDAFYQNNVFLSCLFLDPRFKNIIDEKYVPDIVDHLGELYFKIISMKSEDENYDIDFVDLSDYKSEPNVSENTTNNRSRSPDVNDFIKSMIKPLSDNENNDESKENIKCLLKTFFDSEPLLGVKEDVLKFWSDKKYAYPELYKISQTVFGVSSSHYSINKLTSQLNYLYNPHTSMSLAAPIVNDILTVRVNSDVAKFK